MKDYTKLSLEQVAKLVEAKEVSPVELTEACLAKIDEFNAKYNAFLFVNREAALAKAKAMEKEIADGHYRGKLHGIPISLKDMYYTKGIPTTAGSAILKDFVPDYDSTVAKLLDEAGAILLGKCNTAEFAIGATTAECYFGPSRNPWNPEKITGGSSGGSAVATVTGMSFVSMGTDTGGSCRIPPSLCACVGYKPSVGRVSIYGIIPCGISYDCSGPLARSVADVAITLDAISYPDENDPSPSAMNDGPTHYYDAIKDVNNLYGKRIAVPVQGFFDRVDEDVEKLFDECVERLKKLGADVRKVELPIPPLEKYNDTSMIGMYCEAAWTHREWRRTSKDLYQKGTDIKLDNGSAYGAADCVATQMDRIALTRAWNKMMKDYDAVLVPTTPVTAFDISIGRPWMITARGKEQMGEPTLTWHTRLASVVGGPALTIPMGLTEKGLPAGMMFLGARGDDETILALGLAYERNYEFPKWEEK